MSSSSTGSPNIVVNDKKKKRSANPYIGHRLVCAEYSSPPPSPGCCQPLLTSGNIASWIHKTIFESNVRNFLREDVSGRSTSMQLEELTINRSQPVSLTARDRLCIDKRKAREINRIASVCAAGKTPPYW